MPAKGHSHDAGSVSVPSFEKDLKTGKRQPKWPKKKKRVALSFGTLEASIHGAKVAVQEALRSGNPQELRAAEKTVNKLQEALKQVVVQGEDEETKMQAAHEFVLGLQRDFSGKFDEYFNIKKEYNETLALYFRGKEELGILEKKITNLNTQLSKSKDKLLRLERSRAFAKKVSGKDIFDKLYQDAQKLYDSLSEEIDFNLRAVQTKIKATEILRKKCDELYKQKIDFEKELQKMGLLNIADLRQSEEEFDSINADFKKAEQQLQDAKDQSLNLWKQLKLKFTGTKEQIEEAKNKKVARKKAEKEYEIAKNKRAEAKKDKTRARENLDREINTSLDSNLDFKKEKKKIEDKKAAEEEQKRRKEEETRKKRLSEGRSANARDCSEASEDDNKINQKNIEIFVKTCKQFVSVLEGILKLNPKGFPYIGQPFKVVYKNPRYKNGIPVGVIKESMQTSLSEISHILSALDSLFGEKGIATWMANCPFTTQISSGYEYMNFYQDISVAYRKLGLGIDKMRFDSLISSFGAKVSSAPNSSVKIQKSVSAMSEDINKLLETVSILCPSMPKNRKEQQALEKIRLAHKHFNSSAKDLETVLKNNGLEAKMKKFNDILDSVCDCLAGVSSVISDPLVRGVLQGASMMAKGVGKLSLEVAKILPDGADVQAMTQVQVKISESFESLNKEYKNASKIFKDYIDEALKNNSVLEKQAVLNECLVDIDTANKLLLDFSVSCEAASRNYKMWPLNLHLREHKRLWYKVVSLLKEICLHLMDHHGYKEIQQMKVFENLIWE